MWKKISLLKLVNTLVITEALIKRQIKQQDIKDYIEAL